MEVTERKRRGPQENVRKIGSGVITKTRKVDRDFKRQVENDKVFTREEKLSF